MRMAFGVPKVKWGGHPFLSWLAVLSCERVEDRTGKGQKTFHFLAKINGMLSPQVCMSSSMPIDWIKVHFSHWRELVG